LSGTMSCTACSSVPSPPSNKVQFHPSLVETWDWKQESWNPGEMEWINPVNGCFGFGTGMWCQSSFIKDLRSLPSTYLRRSWRSAARRSLNPSTSSNLEIAAALHFAQTFCLWRV
jgi:hypothetical protein